MQSAGEILKQEVAEARKESKNYPLHTNKKTNFTFYNISVDV